MKTAFFTGIGWMLTFWLCAQSTSPVWIGFHDKGNSSSSIESPVPDDYLAHLIELGIQLGPVSRWLNAASAELTIEQKDALTCLPFVKEIIPITTTFEASGDYKSSSSVLHQKNILDELEATFLDLHQLNGNGVAVGVIDAGFFRADEHRYLKHLFKNDRIKGYRDFVSPGREHFFSEKESSLDNHGTEVLKMLAGQPSEKEQFGLATAADYYLARTDHGDKENRLEEANWIAALEWLDSLGVKLVNTSLGYAKGFDKYLENYSPAQMDGNTSMIAKAAQIAVEQKGMLIVVSAGNEGNDEDWKVISTPADAKGVLSVGAVTEKGLKAHYSSIGTAELSYLKPEVACYSTRGTSFSAPVVAGLAACLWQAYPEASGEEIKNAIVQSGTLFPEGNNFIGYGVPNAKNAFAILKKERFAKKHIEVKIEGEQFSYQFPTNGQSERVAVFHKTDSRMVDRQLLEKSDAKGNVWIEKPHGKIKFSTVQFAEYIVEVEWK